jgi:hypothetical protein
MNERIKEIALQAGGSHYPDVGGKTLEKFAELIVRECLEVIKWTPSQFPNDEYVKNITEHFGVKE